MKHKLLYLNLLTLLLLFMIGFSPQLSSSKVYAAGTDTVEAPKDVTLTENSNYITSVDSYLSSSGNADISGKASAISGNVTSSVSNLTTVIKSLNNSLAVLADVLGVVIICIAGFKYMNSSSGNLAQFIKSKTEIKNALICVVFIMVIPTFTDAILNTKLPSSITFTQKNDTYFATGTLDSSNAGIGTSSLIPESSLKEYFTGKTFSASQVDLVGTSDKAPTGEGFAKTVIDIILKLIALIVYYPLKLIVSVFGIVSFYPVSFDPNLYDKEMVGHLLNPYLDAAKNLFSPFFTDNTSSEVVGGLSSALTQFTIVVNLLYFILKQFVMTAIRLVCYYYGCMHLLKRDTTSVPKFLVRFFEGIFGMLLAPYIIQFMIDMDVMISSSILSLTVQGVPGLGLLTLLPDIKLDNVQLFPLFFGIISACMLLKLCKAFFVRRVEITLYYIVSPIVFLIHMGSKGSSSPVSRWFNTLKSSIFITTMYSPLFAIISLLMALSAATSGGKASIASLIYYMLVIGLMWFSKDVSENIMSLFNIGGGSVAAGMAKKATNVESIKDGLKFGPKAILGAAGAAALATKGGIKSGLTLKRNVETFGKYSNETDKDGKKVMNKGTALKKAFLDPSLSKLKHNAFDKLDDMKKDVIPKTRLEQEKEMEDMKKEREKKKEEESLRKLGVSEEEGHRLSEVKHKSYDTLNEFHEEQDKYEQEIQTDRAKIDKLQNERKEIKDNPQLQNAYTKKIAEYEKSIDSKEGKQALLDTRKELLGNMQAALKTSTPEGQKQAMNYEKQIKQLDIKIDQSSLSKQKADVNFKLDMNKNEHQQLSIKSEKVDNIGNITKDLKISLDAGKLVGNNGVISGDMYKKILSVQENAKGTDIKLPNISQFIQVNDAKDISGNIIKNAKGEAVKEYKIDNSNIKSFNVAIQNTHNAVSSAKFDVGERVVDLSNSNKSLRSESRQLDLAMDNKKTDYDNKAHVIEKEFKRQTKSFESNKIIQTVTQDVNSSDSKNVTKIQKDFTNVAAAQHRENYEKLRVSGAPVQTEKDFDRKQFTKDLKSIPSTPPKSNSNDAPPSPPNPNNNGKPKP